jgi:hypothetical protein
LSNTIKNWGVVFTGNSKGLRVEAFISRVRFLTNYTLGGNFEGVRDNAFLLFDEDAREWFWNFVEQRDSFTWNTLCEGLLKEFHEEQSTEDLMALLRQKKQAQGESFKDYLLGFRRVANKSHVHLSDEILLPILKRNLRDEVRHDLLYQKITSIEDLRKLCAEREMFFSEVRNRYRPHNTYPKRFVSEVEVEENQDKDCYIEEVENPAKKMLICWNCKAEGHKFRDCQAEYSLFCWKCGLEGYTCRKCPRCIPGASSKNFRESGYPKKDPRPK